MSRKYPSADGTRNTEINRERQRYAHTAAYHQKHVEREMRERMQAKVEAFRQSDPGRYERVQQLRSQKSDSSLFERASNRRGSSDSGARPTAAGGGALGLSAEILGGITVGEAAVAVAAVAAIALVAYGSYRLYKWYRRTH